MPARRREAFIHQRCQRAWKRCWRLRKARCCGVFPSKEHSPIIFLDEMDGLPAAGRNVSQDDVQVVERCLPEISDLKPENEAFLIGATNDPDRVDPRVLRGGRFSEKFLIPLPRAEQRVQLLKMFLNGTRLEDRVSFEDIADALGGALPADLQAICTATKRMAFNRLTDGNQLPPLNRSDFDLTAQRVLGNGGRLRTIS